MKYRWAEIWLNGSIKSIIVEVIESGIYATDISTALELLIAKHDPNFRLVGIRVSQFEIYAEDKMNQLMDKYLERGVGINFRELSWHDDNI